jgi:uncharacterized protein
VPSTGNHPQSPERPNWRAAGLRWFSRNFFWREKFGCPVWKVSLDAGLDCPNRDGTLGRHGCIYCNPASFSPSRRMGITSLRAQLDAGVRRLHGRRSANHFVAYFQPATNTYAPVPLLRGLFEEALAHPGVVGLAIGTRPDCLPDEVLDLLTELAGRTWLSVELGLQTIHNRSLDWLRRGHRYEAFLDAIGRSRGQGWEIAVHVILGLPGESRDDMRATARELARLGVGAVKLHNLHAVRDTPLAQWVADGTVTLPGLDEYAGYVADFLEELPPDCVVDRLSGDAPPAYLVGPSWCANKAAVRAAIEGELRRRDTWQGRKYQRPRVS